MLVGLHFKEGTPIAVKEDTGIAVAREIGKRTRVYESKDVADFTEILKGYSPNSRDNLVLVNTHLDFEDDMSLGFLRATDLVFNQKGGVIFGNAAVFESSCFKTKIPEDNLEYIATVADYYESRAKTLKKDVPGYFGRSDSDPHTMVYGFTPSWPKLSKAAELLLANLPDGSEEPWWWGVGFFNRRNSAGRKPAEHYYQEALERFIYSSNIAASETAVEILDSLGTPHQTVDAPRLNTVPEAKAYTRNLRSVARLDLERVVE